MAMDQRSRAGLKSRLPDFLATASPERLLLLVAVPLLLIFSPDILASSRLLDVSITYTIFAIALTGLALLYSQIGFLSIAHAALFGAGAYTAAVFVNELDVGFWAVFPICAIFVSLGALVLGFPSIRISGHHFVITTFAFSELFVLAMTNIGGDNARLGILGGAQGLDIEQPIGSVLGQSFNINISLEPFFYLCLGFLGVMMVLGYAIINSRLGRTFRAIRENEPLAKSVGIQANQYKIVAFMISGVFAGVAGALYAYKLRHIAPPLFGAFPGVQFAMMMLLGGAGSFLGPLVGAIVVGFLPEALDLAGLPVAPFERQIIFGLLLVGVIVLLPQGLVNGISSLYIFVKSWILEAARPRPPAEVAAAAGRDGDDGTDS